MTNPRSRFESEEEYRDRLLKESQDAAHELKREYEQRKLERAFPKNDEGGYGNE